jgi:hypothetical protein
MPVLASVEGCLNDQAAKQLANLRAAIIPELHRLKCNRRWLQMNRMARRTDEWWAFAARWYHEKIAKPDSDEHRQNMLRGYPTWHLLKFIDPNQEDDPL